MSNAKVVNVKHDQYDVYIGRPSIWGNPFKVGVDGTLDEVLMKHRLWLPQQPHLMSRIHELKDKRIGCWCKPKRCHGDFLLELANKNTLFDLFGE